MKAVNSNLFTILSLFFVLIVASFVSTPAVQAVCDYPTSVSACIGDINTEFGLVGPGGAQSGVSWLLDKLIKFFLWLAVPLALLAIVIGAFMYIASFGDESKAARAKNIVLFAILGLLLMGAAGLIIVTIRQIAGL